jgi:hypothetical protein
MLLRLDQPFSMLAPLTYHLGQNLTAFLGGVLSKKYTNPSSDVIALLAGLDEVDKRVSDLVNGIDVLARNGSSSESTRSCEEARLIFSSPASRKSNRDCIGTDSGSVPNRTDLLPHSSGSLSSADEGNRIELQL